MPTYDANTSAQWPLEEDPTGVGACILDATGNGHHGDPFDMEAGDLVPGVVGNSLVFGGAEAVIVPHAAGLDDLAEFTVSFWAKQTAAADDQYLITKGTGLQIFTTSVGFGQTGIRFKVPYNTVNADAISTDVFAGLEDWHWYVCSIGADGQPHIYIDGVEVTYGTQISGEGGRFADASQDLLIGTGPFFSGYWLGNFDEIQVDHVERDATWVSDTFDSFDVGPPPPTVSTAIITTDGKLRMQFSESVSFGADSSDGVTLAPDGGAATVVDPATGAPGTDLEWETSRILVEGETLTRSYVQPGDGIKATTGGALVASFTDQTVTNQVINAPTDLAVTAAGSSLGVTLDYTGDSPTPAATQIDVQFDTVNTFDDDPQTASFAIDAAQPISVGSDLPPGEWFVRAYARNGNGSSLASNTDSATIEPVLGEGPAGVSVQDDGESLALEILVNKTAPDDAVLHFFNNDFTPTEDTELEDLIDASDYTAPTLTGGNWNITGTNQTRASYARQVVTFTGAAGFIYGWYLQAGSRLIGAERFSDGPYEITGFGDAIRLLPQIQTKGE